jgi:NAD(P) transhydrogenase subunit alpha
VPGYWEEALYVFLLASFLGLEVIRRVPPLLHTPLMSLTNAISGIALVGSLVVAGAEHSVLSMWLGLVAVTASSINVVGGFLITDRMLRMFRRRLPARRADGPGTPSSGGGQAPPGAR